MQHKALAPKVEALIAMMQSQGGYRQTSAKIEELIEEIAKLQERLGMKSKDPRFKSLLMIAAAQPKPIQKARISEVPKFGKTMLSNIRVKQSQAEEMIDAEAMERVRTAAQISDAVWNVLTSMMDRSELEQFIKAVAEALVDAGPPKQVADDKVTRRGLYR